MKLKIIIVVFLIILIKLINGLLFIRPYNVYEHVINDIKQYYQCDYILIFYSSSKNVTAIDVEITTQLVNLQLHFNKNLFYINIISINILTDQQTLKTEIMKYYSRKSLFVFLNDFEEEKLLLHTLFASSLDVSIPKWLFFFGNKTTINEFFNNTYIPFNSHCLVSNTNFNNSEVITEVYQIQKDGEFLQNIIADWNFDDGIQVSASSLYQRRNNLFGYHFRVSTISDPPYTIVSQTPNNKIQLGGIIGKVMEHLKEKLNFTVTYRLTKDYGNRLNESWTGGIADLVNNVSDIFASSLLMTSLRKIDIDFTKPLFFAEDRFFFKKSDQRDIKWNKFLMPFGKDVWIIIICLINITSSIVTLISLFHKRVNRKKFIENRESCFISDHILGILGAFCGQAIHRSSINSVIIIHITLHITATIILAAYSGLLISTLTISNFEAPFKTLRGFSEDGTYQMGFVQSFGYRELFKVSNDTIMKKIYNTAVTYDAMTSTTQEGINRMCSENTYAFLAPKYFGNAFYADDCTLVASSAVLRLSKGIGMQQHNPFQALLNYHILRMRKYGILDRIVRDSTKLSSKSTSELWETVEMHDVMPILVLLIIASLLGFVVLFIENQVHKRFERKRLSNISLVSVNYFTNTLNKKNQLSPF